MLTAEQRQLNSQTQASTRLLASIFVLTAAALFAALSYWVGTTEAIVNSARTPGALAWNSLQTVGVVRPLLIILAGALLLRLSSQLSDGSISAARWATLLYNWLVIITGAVAVARPLLVWFNRNTPAADRLADTLASAAPAVALFILMLIVRQVVAAHAATYSGEEDIQAKNARRAWNMLTPLLIAFLVIGISPLERVFITSLTDERFASSQEITFLGLENYTQLLSIRLDTVPCNTGDDGACLLNPDGSIDYPRPRSYYPRDSVYNELRYRDFNAITLFGQYWVISARDPEFVEALGTSIYYTVVAIVLQFSIGFLMAMIIAQRTRGIGIMRVVMLVPMAIPTLIASQFWEVMLRGNATGLFNALLLQTGLIDQPQQWLLTPELQVPTLVAVIVWKETPITALLLLPGLLAIPREVYQAAAIDGANRVQRFFQVTLPIMRPTIGVVLVLRTMLFLRVFDLFDVLLGRDRFVLATYAHDVLIQRQQLGYSSAISVTIFAITMIFTVAYMRTLRIDEA